MIFLPLVFLSSTVQLGDLDISHVDQQWGQPQRNLSIDKKPLKLGDRVYETGLGTHANSEFVLEMDGRGESFTAQVGLDANSDGAGSIRFSVIGDGKVLWRSDVLHRGESAIPVSVSLKGVKALLLKVDDAGDGNDHDHADWADAKISFSGEPPKPLEGLPATPGVIRPSKRWFDTDGQKIQAHGGGLLKVGRTYYWYGEEKSQGYNNKVGVACYSSTDLMKWRNEGVALPASAFPTQFTDKGVCERPKVIYNAKTKQYVMWMHLDANGYGISEAGVATAMKPAGPFTFISHFRPVKTSTYRDMNLFVDTDGKAYTFYSGEDNGTMHVVRLNDAYTAPEMPMIEGKTWARILVNQWREAPAPFKFKNKYYLITSACTGWAANEAGYAVADNILGPWTDKGNPAVGIGSKTTFGSQSTFVFPYGKGFVFMADRWNSQNLADSRYMWLPFTVGPDDKIEIRWQDEWSPKSKM